MQKSGKYGSDWPLQKQNCSPLLEKCLEKYRACIAAPQISWNIKLHFPPDSDKQYVYTAGVPYTYNVIFEQKFGSKIHLKLIMCSPAGQKKVFSCIFLLASLIEMYVVLQKVQSSGSKLKKAVWLQVGTDHG